MRGKHSFRPSRSGGSASTPAYAGQTLTEAGLIGSPFPLPPHMRGKRSGPRGAGRVPASTPAYAGQTGRQWCGGCGGGLYPRICGANPIRLDFPGNKPPLPPHMRGKRGCRSCCGGRMASTPAYAGQTRPVHPGEGSLRLYPRICGANLVPLLCVDVDEPLPPHMRGKHL